MFDWNLKALGKYVQSYKSFLETYDICVPTANIYVKPMLNTLKHKFHCLKERKDGVWL